jgi:hypothetical protein
MKHSERDGVDGLTPGKHEQIGEQVPVAEQNQIGKQEPVDEPEAVCDPDASVDQPHFHAKGLESAGEQQHIVEQFPSDASERVKRAAVVPDDEQNPTDIQKDPSGIDAVTGPLADTGPPDEEGRAHEPDVLHDQVGDENEPWQSEIDRDIVELFDTAKVTCSLPVNIQIPSVSPFFRQSPSAKAIRSQLSEQPNARHRRSMMNRIPQFRCSKMHVSL